MAFSLRLERFVGGLGIVSLGVGIMFAGFALCRPRRDRAVHSPRGRHPQRSRVLERSELVNNLSDPVSIVYGLFCPPNRSMRPDMSQLQ